MTGTYIDDPSMLEEGNSVEATSALAKNRADGIGVSGSNSDSNRSRSCKMYKDTEDATVESMEAVEMKKSFNLQVVQSHAARAGDATGGCDGRTSNRPREDSERECQDDSSLLIGKSEGGSGELERKHCGEENITDDGRSVASMEGPILQVGRPQALLCKRVDDGLIGETEANHIENVEEDADTMKKVVSLARDLNDISLQAMQAMQAMEAIAPTADEEDVMDAFEGETPRAGAVRLAMLTAERTAKETGCRESVEIISIDGEDGKIDAVHCDCGRQLSFHEAVRAGDDKCVEMHLVSGAIESLDEPDWNVSGDPPLLVAATNHCLPVLSLLLAKGCEPGVRSPRGESALHRAIGTGGATSPGVVLSLVEELLKYGCPAGVKEAGGGQTALHVYTRQLAHSQGSKNLGRDFAAALRTLDVLAKAGPVNAKDHQGRTALHILASSTAFDASQTVEMEAIIESLLAAGADPALKNDRGESPLHESLECGALNIALSLIARTPIGLTSRYGETPLHIASRKNYIDVVEKLLESGEDPSLQDAGGNTPLHLASARGFHQVVSLLVISPLAQLEKVNGDGLTALQVAAESGFISTVKLLLKAGADPTQTIHYCATSFHRHPDISVLIDHELARRRQLAA